MSNRSSNKRVKQGKSDRIAKLENATKISMIKKAEDKKPMKKIETCIEPKRKKIVGKSIKMKQRLSKNEDVDKSTTSAVKTEKKPEMLDGAKYSLQLFNGDEFEKPLFFKEKEVYIGGDDDCDAVCKGIRGIAGKHCSITVDSDDKAFLDPLDGITYLNEEILRKKTMLNDFDIITIAKRRLLFNYNPEFEFDMYTASLTSKADRDRSENISENESEDDGFDELRETFDCLTNDICKNKNLDYLYFSESSDDSSSDEFEEEKKLTLAEWLYGPSNSSSSDSESGEQNTEMEETEDETTFPSSINFEGLKEEDAEFLKYHWKFYIDNFECA